MKLLTLLLLQGTLGYRKQGSCVNEEIEKTTEQRLRRHILSCYQPQEPPPNQNATNPLTIKVLYIINHFTYFTDEQIFSINEQSHYTWVDDRLKWDPKQFDGKTNIVITSFKLWTPGIRVINGIDDFNMKYSFTSCSVIFNGRVKCKQLLSLNVGCVYNINEWPYDIQDCKVEIGPYAEEGVTINIITGLMPNYLITKNYGGSWKLAEFEEERHQNSVKHLTMKFRLTRHVGVISCMFVIPSLLFSILTLSSVFIDGRRKRRLLLICFSLLCHFFLLSEIPMDISKHSMEAPKTLLFFRGSLIMSTIGVVISFIFDHICRITKIAPNGVVKFNEFVFSSQLAVVIWPLWESVAERNTDASVNTKNWINFANICNSVWLIVTVIVYVSMYCILIPNTRQHFHGFFPILKN